MVKLAAAWWTEARASSIIGPGPAVCPAATGFLQINPQLCTTGCGEFFENSHVLNCEVLNQESKFDLNSLINGSLNEMRICLKQWKENMKNIEAIDSMDSLVQC